MLRSTVNALCMMISAAFSAIMTVGAPVCPPGILGITDESAMRIPVCHREVERSYGHKVKIYACYCNTQTVIIE